MLAVFTFRADEVACIDALAPTDECGHDIARQALTVTDDGILCLLAQVVDKIYALIDTLQLLEEMVNGVKKFYAFLVVGDDRVNHLVMAVNDSVELSLVTLVALKSQLRSRNQLVRDAAEGTDNHYYRPVFGLFLYNFL